MAYGEIKTNAGWFHAVDALLTQGFLGVPLFFVISGFCIHLKWAKQYSETGKQHIPFVAFWKRRFKRLYPPYLIALCIAMLLVFLAYWMGKNVPLVTMYPLPRPRWMVLDFVAHLFMLHGFYPMFFLGGGDPPFWTLACEEYFYLLYFVLLAVRRSYGLLTSFIGVLILGPVFVLVMTHVVPADPHWLNLLYHSAIFLWVQWVLGMVAVESYFGIIRLPAWLKSIWLVPVWGMLGKVAEMHAALLSPVLFGLACFTFLNWCVEKEKNRLWKRSALTNWLARVGVFSYSLYLVHNPVRGIGKQLLGHFAITNSPVVYLVNVLLLAMAGYFTGKLFFSLVERHFLTDTGFVKEDSGLPEQQHSPAMELETANLTPQ
jgi:peptidoglycan/LPS O-acetylase OafA/YrhL